MKNLENLLKKLIAHEEFRSKTINMIASENRTSPLVRIMMACDLAHRYSDELYGGTHHIRGIMEFCQTVLQKLFNAPYVLTSPISGNFAVLSAVLGLTKPGGLVAKVFSEDGGYPLNLTAFNRLGLKLPFDTVKRTVDIDRSSDAILKTPPSIIMLGQSVFTHPHPVQAFKTFISDKIPKTPLVFDGSHVLGLIAGKKFQDPLREGADVLLGSTHKTFFGPQGGVLLSNNRKLFKKIARVGAFTQGSHTLVDNIHPHRIGALAVAALELQEFGTKYATQVIKNSQALAQQFHKKGLPVKGSNVGFTQSHQVLLDYPQNIAFNIKNKLESIGIITDALLRFGTSEITRLGMKEPEMKEIGNLVADCIQENLQLEKLMKNVEDLTQNFQTVQYTFDISTFSSIQVLIRKYFPF